MMTLEQRAAALFPNNVNYQAAWVRIVTLLGDKWLLRNPVLKVSK